MEGIAAGIVKENWNSDHPGKVRVEYSLSETGLNETKWISVMSPFAGPGYGTYMLPEVGVEVIIGFLHGNKNCPIVLGCPWNIINALPGETAKEDNTIKLVRFKGGSQILLDEQEDSLTLDLVKTFRIMFEGEEFMTVEQGVISIKGAVELKTDDVLTWKCKDMVIEPEGSLKIGGRETEIAPSQGVVIKGSKTEVKPAQAFELNSLQVKLSGTTVEIKGQASAKLEGDGIVEVKGSLLKLN